MLLSSELDSLGDDNINFVSENVKNEKNYQKKKKKVDKIAKEGLIWRSHCNKGVALVGFKTFSPSGLSVSLQDISKADEEEESFVLRPTCSQCQNQILTDKNRGTQKNFLHQNHWSSEVNFQ